MGKKIRVLAADDSGLFRKLVEELLNPERFELIAETKDSAETEEKIHRLHPDVVLLDVEMPGENGLELLKRIMQTCPVSVVVVTATAVTVFDALEAGAVDFLKKPMGDDKEGLERFKAELNRKLLIAAAGTPGRVSGNRELHKFPPLSREHRDAVIVIGASTGGTDAVQTVLQSLPYNMPPILVVQHMPAGFTEMYAKRIDGVCDMKALEARDGLRLESGMIVIAAGGYHLRLEKDLAGYYISSRQGERVSGHCPSVDVLFDSAAKKAGANAIGILMTGMGADGAKGLLTMKNAGAVTIGQDESTCVVYGMPMEAKKLGAVCKELPLGKIAEELYRELG